MEVLVRIKRFNPEKDEAPYWAEYKVPAQPSDRILDLLNYIKWEIDGTLSYRRSCAHGICGSDAVVLNGVNRLACRELVKNVGNRIEIEPIRGLPVIKDLIVDMEPFFAGYKAIQPFLIADDPPADGKERYQSPEERARFDDTTKCILCAACTTSCPIFWTNDVYVGPAAIVNAHRFIFDSRDRGAQVRLDVLNTQQGVWRCRTIFNCTDACPRGIQVTKAIQEVKQEIVLEKL